MNRTQSDNVHTTIFTPQEYQVELIDACLNRNTLVLLAPQSTRTFLITMVTRELSYKSKIDDPKLDQKTLIIGKHGTKLVHVAEAIQQNTNLSVVTYTSASQVEDWVKEKWLKIFVNAQVIVMTAEVFSMGLKFNLNLAMVKLLVMMDVHHLLGTQTLKKTLTTIHPLCRILALTTPVLKRDFSPPQLEKFLSYLKESTNCTINASSEVITILRCIHKPQQLFVMCHRPDFFPKHPIEATVRSLISDVRSFMLEHRYDPVEVYGPEYAEFCVGIPDPKKEPMKIIQEFLWVLDNYGIWCADRAALYALIEIEKMKRKTAYDRHYLLLCAIFTSMVRVRAAIEETFTSYSDISQIFEFSSPKILRLLEILRKIQPKYFVNPRRKREYFEDSSKAPLELENDKETSTVKDISDLKLSETCETEKDQTADEVTSEFISSESATKDIEISDVTTDVSKLNISKSSGASKDVDGSCTETSKDQTASCDNENNCLKNSKLTLNGISGQEDADNEACKTDSTVSNVKNISVNTNVGLSGVAEKAKDRRHEKYRRHYGYRGRHGGTLSDGLSQMLPGHKHRRRRDDLKIKVHNPDDPESVCGIIFVETALSAKIIYRLLKELSATGGDFGWIFPQYTTELTKDPKENPRLSESEHKKQEEVLRRFRHNECNMIVSTSILEHGIDIPSCNLVVRFDPTPSYSSYVYSYGKAKGKDTFFLHLIVDGQEEEIMKNIASFKAFEKVIIGQCHNKIEKGTDTEISKEDADKSFNSYQTLTGAKVTMSTAIALLNKYCAKLPSDTFTRLTPSWQIETRNHNKQIEYKCVIILPINSPLKGYTTGPWMSKISLAKMSVALICCQRLHETGELDDGLNPVGKESLPVHEMLCPPLPEDEGFDGFIRPGTTKRRQYYYKKVANCLVGQQPSARVSMWVYKLEMKLTCAIPEEQNTRGRKIYHPESSAISLGLVATKPIPQISGFPVFTRSGEVLLNMKQLENQLMVGEEQMHCLQSFHKYTFSQVLRLEKYPIEFHPEKTKTTFYIVPLVEKNGECGVDWDFAKTIETQLDDKTERPSEESRQNFTFDESKYYDAVVMPWYRNQDQPQYFYVAEICYHLNPQSDFPDAGFKSFENYYLNKYGIQMANLKQPLLDVDHTSGRLNLLTPRHINRKGVALPTTSDETKKAKRENLQQKQILVPELCSVHPFSASLWRKVVCLPTILYRINSLLIADEVRTTVAREIGLGLAELPKDFCWPNHHFGWCLADVLRRHKETPRIRQIKQTVKTDVKSEVESDSDNKLEIGTWSNEMALDSSDMYGYDDELDLDPTADLPDNLMILDGDSIPFDDEDKGWGSDLQKSWAKNAKSFRVGSPSNFEIDTWDNFPSIPASSYGKNVSYEEYDDYEDFDTDTDDEEDDKSDSANWVQENQKSSNYMGTEAASEDDEESDYEWQDDDDCDNSQYTGYIDQTVAQLTKEDTFLSAGTALYIKKHCRVNLPELPIHEKRSVFVAKACGVIFLDDFDIEKFGAVYCKNCTVCGEEITEENKLLFENKIPQKRPEYEYYGQSYQVDNIPVQINREATLKCIHENNIYLGCFSDQTTYEDFSFDLQPDLVNHSGPSPSIILQGLTMSNANDGVNLERLETIGDSFLKYAITTFLYCTYKNRHEGKLSYLRSKQVSNLNLYRLGKKKGLGECMIATKFEPHDNWLPPGYFIPYELEEALIDSGVPAAHWNMADFPGLHELPKDEIRKMVQERSEQIKQSALTSPNPDLPLFIPYNLLTQHSIPDKSIADCVEALIGAYLTTCGPRGALIFMTWLGIKVLPSTHVIEDGCKIVTYEQLLIPPSPLAACPFSDAKQQLILLLSGYEEFESKINYTFQDASYLLQAFTHASYSRNRLTDCYQRLEFLGDAVLDYLITRHLYEDKRLHSPGALTDLRSALVNNTIFASLAVKYEFHKYFRHFSPGLDRVVRDFVKMQEENGHKINEEYYLMDDTDECETAEDIEVPKALGDVFESVAGAIFLDSGGSLDAVWKVYYSMMKSEIEQFSNSVPKSPIRELLEMEPETAKFGKPERLVDGKVRVSVEIFGKGSFSGVGRNYRIAKSTAAKRALRCLKKFQVKPM